MLVLILSAILVSTQIPLPSVKTENPVVKNEATYQTKAEVHQQKKVQPNKGGTVDAKEHAIQATTDNDRPQEKPQNRVYMIHEVSPPDAKDGPLFLPYLIVTIGGVVVNAFVLGLIWKQTQINGQQLRINFITAKASIRSARAATKSADALVASERAWVMVDLEWPPSGLTRGETQTVFLLYCICRNEGKTPAWIKEIKCQLAFVDTFKYLSFSSAPTCRYEPVSIAAGEKDKRYSLDIRCNTEQDKFLIVFGVVEYRDMFGNDRTTTFAYRVGDSRLNRIASFPEYNQNT
jgi:hypothetical protein